jgi:retron-type reverse transcriptase
MREKDSGIVNGHSGIVNTDYGKSIKAFTIPPEPVFTMDQNSCSQCVRIGVHVRPEYAFARYADDFIILVRSQRAGERVLESISRFLEKRLKLVVNTDKSKVVKTRESKFLGFTFA